MSISSKRVKKWRSSTKDKMVESMGGKCQCCGYNTTNKALAFHHINPNEKELRFADTRANPKSWTKIVEELRKCILVCHNCHSEIHEGIREIPKQYSKFNEAFLDYRKVAEYNDCPICGKDKPTKQKFCSQLCAQKNKRKVDWESIDLLDLMSKYSISELEKMLNISNAAIYKRRDKLLKNNISVV